MDVRMEKPGFSPERPPAALQPARRLSWLASERARLCLSLPTQSGLVEVPPCMCACMRPSSWLGRHSMKTGRFLDCGR